MVENRFRGREIPCYRTSPTRLETATRQGSRFLFQKVYPDLERGGQNCRPCQTHLYRTYAFLPFLSFPRRRESSIWPFFNALDSRFHGNDTNCVSPTIVLDSRSRDKKIFLLLYAV